jgi:hypothetical protein
MYAFRRISLVVLVALVAVFALGAFGSTAEAGHHGHGHHHHGHFHVKYPSHISYGTYWPTYQFVKPISYPVTYYDCYGRPYVVWQTSYSTNPLW